MKRNIKLLLSLCLISSIFPSDVTGKERKSVFIIVDGIPADIVERVATPAINEIAARGGYTRAYTGGETGGITQTPTVSCDGYMNLLTSTWGNKHNVINNVYEQPNYHYWNIFRIAKNQQQNVRTAVFSSWTENRLFLIGEGKAEAGNVTLDFVLDGLDRDNQNYPAEKDDLQIFKIDEKISESAAACIRENAPDLMWVYLWYTDDAGHIYGNGDYMDRYVALADRQVARVWEAVKYREENYDEEWMIVVVTDHGRDDKGYGHGGQSERERTIWISTNVKPNTYFVQKQPAITDIAVSIARFMDFSIPQDVQNEQEGTPFIGPLSITNVKATQKDNQYHLTWESDDNAPVDIYYAVTDNFKEGGTDTWQKAGTVEASRNQFLFDASGQPSNFLKFSVRGKENRLAVVASDPTASDFTNK